MEYLSKSHLDWLDGFRHLYERRITASRIDADASIFISYSSKDRPLVEKVSLFLAEFGVKVYVDFLDKTLGEDPNQELADELRQRIWDNKKFLVVATENSRQSKWVPWELGCADGRKDDADIASLPVVARSGDTYQGTEYLRLYSQIAKNEENWYVFEANTARRVPLKDWLCS